MATFQIEIPDAERELFERRAKQEGRTIESWLRMAAYDRLARMPEVKAKRQDKLASLEELRAFFKRIDEMYGPNPEPEPDWEEHLRVLNESRMRGAAPT